MAQLGLNRRHLWALFRLRAKLTLRQFSREKGRIIGAIVVILVLAPIAVGAAIGTAVGYRTLELKWASALMGGVLVVLWLIWLVFPVIASSINEGMDITRLLIYPLARRDLIVSTLLGTLFDYPTYLMLPLLIAIFVGFGLGPAFPIVLLGLLLSYGHMVVIGQLVITAVGGILQSRRFRDVVIVVMALLGFPCYFFNVTFQRGIESLSESLSLEQEEVLAQTLANLDPLNILQWFPTGASARAIEQAAGGSWLLALGWLLYSAVLLALLTWIWVRLLTRLATGEGFLLSAPLAARQKTKKSRRADGRNWLGWLPDDIAAMVRKELRFAWRIPQRRVGLIQGILIPFFMAGPFLFTFDFSTSLPDWAGLGIPLYALFLFWINTQNMLAWEGKGLPTLLLTPAPRHRIFWAKGIVLALVSGAPLLLIGSGIVAFSRSWVSVAGLATGLCMGIASMAVTAVASVLFPIPMNLEAKSARSAFQSGGDFKTGCASMTIVPISVAVVSLPAGLPLIIAYLLEQPLIGWIGILFSAAYAVGIFWGGSKLAGNLLLEREPELVASLKQPDDD